MSDSATNENLREGRGERGDFGKDQRVGMKKGWETKPFEDCIESVKYTRKIQRKDFLDDGQFPIVSQEAEFTNGYWDDEADVFKVSTPVVIFGDHTQVLKYVDFDFVLGADGVKILPPRDFLRPKFFFYQLQAANFTSLGYARHYRLLKELEINYPPLAEQQRIVGLLDEAFEGLATAKANAEKNLQNARALFESHLQSVFTQRGPGWVDRQLDSLCHEITVGHVGSMKTEYKASGIPFLRSQNIRPFEVSMENAMFIDEAFHRALKKSQLRPGDLAIVRTGYPGTAAVIPPELPDSNCSDLVIVRPSKEVNPHFLAAFFNSAFGKQLVLGKIVGAAQKHFNITAAKEVMLHVPPIPEQRTIIAMVDDLREQTHHLARLYEQKLAALEALKKSLLHQAFTGEL